MKKLILAFLIVALWAAGCNSPTQVSTQTSATENTPTSNTIQTSPAMPSSEGQYLSTLQNDLDPLIKNWQSIIVNQPSSPRLSYSANLVFISGVYLSQFHFSLDTLEKYAYALKEAGVSRIDMNPSLGPWLKTDPQSEADRAHIDSLVSYIHSLGLQVVINPEFMPGDLTVNQFSDYENAVLQVYPEIAKDHPDILILVHEPSTMASRMNLTISPAQWRQFVIDTSKVVKEASPSTQIGAGVLYYEMPTFRQWLDPSLDYLTLDIYDPSHFDIYIQMIQLAQQHGKSVYVEETWDSLYPGQDKTDPENLTGALAYQQADQLWLQAINLFAKAYRLTAITPFWSFTFFSYLQTGQGVFGSPYITQVRDAILQGRTTRTFSDYQQIVNGG